MVLPVCLNLLKAVQLWFMWYVKHIPKHQDKIWKYGTQQDIFDNLW